MSKIICPFCEMEIKENDEKYTCPNCNIMYHKECWSINEECIKCKNKESVTTTVNMPSNEDASNKTNTAASSPENGTINTNENTENSISKKNKGVIIAVIIAIVAILGTVVFLNGGLGNSSSSSYSGPYEDLQGTWVDSDPLDTINLSVNNKFIIEGNKGYYYSIFESGENVVGEDEPSFYFTLVTIDGNTYCQEADGTNMWKIKRSGDYIELYHKSSSYTKLDTTMIKA